MSNILRRPLLVFVTFLLLIGLVRAAEPLDLSRYQVILKRSPFGATPADATPVVQKFANLEFVGLVTSQTGDSPLQAIIYDRDANRSYFRAKGERIGTDVLMEEIVQFPTPRVVLRCGLETGTLTYSERPKTPVATAPVKPGQIQTVGSLPRPTPRIPFRRGN